MVLYWNLTPIFNNFLQTYHQSHYQLGMKEPLKCQHKKLVYLWLYIGTINLLFNYIP